MRTFFLIAVLALSAAALGHADIDERIAALDEQIAQRPATRKLHVKRGELHRLHRDWASALADYRRAHELTEGGDATDIDFYTGRMWREAGKPERALFHLDVFIDKHPTHVDARINRSRVYAELDQPAAAVDDLHISIRQQQPPSPELYLERARLLIGKDMEQHEFALQGLDEGIARLGPIISLVQFAIDVQVDCGNYRDALLRIDSLPEMVRENPSWRGRKADILSAMGKDTEAHLEYQRAVAAIERLPPSRRSTKVMSELEQDLKNKLLVGAATAEK